MIVKVEFDGSKYVAIHEIKIYNGSMRTKVKKCRNYTIGIDITNGRASTMNGNPYFKIYSGTYGNSNKSARIDMRTGEQIIHRDGKENLEITVDILDWLDEVFDYQCTNNEYSNYSVYEALWAFASSRGYNSITIVSHPSKDEFMKIMRNRYNRNK